MSDTFLRQWMMLRLIPRYPVKPDAASIKGRLSREGFDVTQRTIQRDLMTLSDIFPITSDEQSKPFGWSWAKDANVMDIPGLDGHAALTFQLVQKFLEPVMPVTTVQRLTPHFRVSAGVLDAMQKKEGLPSWQDKVRVIRRGPHQLPPEINPEVQDAVYEALLYGRKLKVDYTPRREKGAREYEVNPLGLVLKDGVPYLVATLWEYEDIKQLLLHRMQQAEVLDISRHMPDGFDLDAYLARGEFGYPEGENIRLVIAMSAGAAAHLEEMPLSNDQTISEMQDSRIQVEATVQNTAELKWWLLGYGDQIEVLEPQALRDEMSAIAHNMAALYPA